MNQALLVLLARGDDDQRYEAAVSGKAEVSIGGKYLREIPF
jgi:hypothetical protein